MSNWERTGKIIKNTFAMAKKDNVLYVPPILNLFVSMLLIVLAILVMVQGNTVGGDFGIPTLYYVGALALVFLAFVAGAFFSAALSWMVLQIVQGKKPSLGAGLGRAVKKTGSLLIYAGVSLVVMLLANQLRKDNDRDNFIVAIIKGFFADLIEKAWDIASHLLLPAIVLTNRNFYGAVKELPAMMKNLPAVLVGGFAFDFIVGWIYLLELLIAFILFMIIPGTVGLIVALSVFFILWIATYIFYVFVKSVYFTMLYIDMHPELKKR